jgi:dCTP deaminase
VILSGRDLRLYVEDGLLSIEPSKPEQYQQNGFDAVLDSARHVTGAFWLGCTRERFALPRDLMAFVGLRSTWARLGFMLPPTIVDAGFEGQLTLEIAMLGLDEPPVGEPFAHLIFARTTGPCAPYEGRYQGQSGITGAKVTNKTLQFTPEEMTRLRCACRDLGTSYVEFVRHAVVEAIDEHEGVLRHLRAGVLSGPERSRYRLALAVARDELQTFYDVDKRAETQEAITLIGKALGNTGERSEDAV